METLTPKLHGRYFRKRGIDCRIFADPMSQGLRMMKQPEAWRVGKDVREADIVYPSEKKISFHLFNNIACCSRGSKSTIG